jgi:ribosome modulation factor
MTIRTLTRQARERLERALNRKEERLAAARYSAATGYDLPLAERSEWLRHAAQGAPTVKHRVS